MPNVIPKPWGHELIIEQNDKYVVKQLFVKPNSRLSLQYHEEKIETMFLVAGKGFLEVTDVNDRDSVMSVGMKTLIPYHISRRMVHRLFTKDESCLVVEVSSTELDDVVRLSDDYGRIDND
jgi:mannose-6-phosphate isomerase-like protein (cupin superfamily)